MIVENAKEIHQKMIYAENWTLLSRQWNCSKYTGFPFHPILSQTRVMKERNFDKYLPE